MSPLPTEMTPRAEIPPQRARVMLIGPPGSGKSSLASSFLPKRALIIDTQHGTDLIEGDHYVAHVKNKDEFVRLVNDLVNTAHDFDVVVIDLIDDIWDFFDAAYAGKNAALASATDDFQNSINEARGMFRREIGRLFASDLGVWLIGHAREKNDGKLTVYQGMLNDPKVSNYVKGACQFIWSTQKVGVEHVLHTQQTAQFECKSRDTDKYRIPSPIKLDEKTAARRVWAELDRALNPDKYAKKAAAEAEPAVATEPADDLPAVEEKTAVAA